MAITMGIDTGPYLKAAVFCDDIIEGKDGVLSLVRIIDRLTITAAGAEAPQGMPAVNHVLKLVVMLVSGRARGSHSLQLRIEKPDGTSTPGWENTVLFEGEDRGANLVAEIQTTFETEGLYWFDLTLDGEPITRLPYRVIYQRVGPATSPR
jgi:hypothetical protein